MSAQNRIECVTDLSQGVRMVRLGRLFAQSDSAAHRLSIAVKEGALDADLSGMTATCLLIRADDSTVTIPGNISGSTVTVTLTSSCYEVPGHFSLIVKVAGSGVSTAVFWADGTVTRSSTDIIVDPDHIVPDLAALLAQIENIDRATEGVEEAVSAASTAAASATTAAGQATTAAGQATTAASAADTAASSATSAATAANTAASSANTAATAADTAADRANDAADAVIAELVPQISIGTVTAVSDPADAAVTMTGTASQPVLNFALPRGQDGARGLDGPGSLYLESTDTAQITTITVPDAVEDIDATLIPMSSSDDTAVSTVIASLQSQITALSGQITTLSGLIEAITPVTVGVTLAANGWVYDSTAGTRSQTVAIPNVTLTANATCYADLNLASAAASSMEELELNWQKVLRVYVDANGLTAVCVADNYPYINLPVLVRIERR